MLALGSVRGRRASIVMAIRIAALLGVCCLTGCASYESPMPAFSDISISSESAARLLRQGKIRLIDTRSPAERSGREILHSIPIPFGAELWTEHVTAREKAFFLERLVTAGLSREDVIVTVCNAGVRAKAAAEFLRSAGFLKVNSVSGGYLGSDSDPGWQFAQ